MRPHVRCAPGTVVLLAACVAMAAGCAAAHPATGPAASPGPREHAVADAAAILRAFAVPPGARRLPQAPDALKVPITTLVSTTLVDDVSFWRAPGQPQAVLAWEQAHLPRRFTLGDADFGPPSWDRMFSLAPVPGVLTARDLVVEVTGAGHGQTAIRVDAQVSWQPPRPGRERVPGAARVVTITQLPSLDPRAGRLLPGGLGRRDPADVSRPGQRRAARGRARPGPLRHRAVQRRRRAAARPPDHRLLHPAHPHAGRPALEGPLARCWMHPGRLSQYRHPGRLSRSAPGCSTIAHQAGWLIASANPFAASAHGEMPHPMADQRRQLRALGFNV